MYLSLKWYELIKYLSFYFDLAKKIFSYILILTSRQIYETTEKHLYLKSSDTSDTDFEELNG